MIETYVYIAGPYMGLATHDHHSYFIIDAHIREAQEAALFLAGLGFGLFCPHTHSAHNEVIAPEVPASYWYEIDMHFLEACTCVLRLPGASKGADAEVLRATELGMPVYYNVVDLINGEYQRRQDEFEYREGEDGRGGIRPDADSIRSAA